MSTTTSLLASPADAGRLLHRVLLLDAATCVATGLLMAGLAGPLARLTDIAQPLLLGAGLFLFPTAALIVFTATLGRMRPALVMLVILGNAAWVLGSLYLLAGGAGANGIGVGFIAVQAAVVAGLAWLEVLGLRRMAG